MSCPIDMLARYPDFLFEGQFPKKLRRLDNGDIANFPKPVEHHRVKLARVFDGIVGVCLAQPFIQRVAHEVKYLKRLGNKQVKQLLVPA